VGSFNGWAPFFEETFPKVRILGNQRGGHQKMDLTFCITCQKVFVNSPIDDFGGAVEWNAGNRGENCVTHLTEKLRIDFSHFSSDGEIEKVYRTAIFLVTGQNSGENFLIKRSRTTLSMPAEYEIIAKGEQAVNAYNSAALRLRRDFRE
jgi:hypothetical protein